MDNLKELIEGLELDKSVFTEAVVEKMATVIESQLTEAKKTIEADLKEEYEQELVEYKQYLSGMLDKYLNEFVNEFVEDNKEQIHESVKVKTAEKILSTFNNIVNDFNLQLSEDTVSDSLESDRLKEELNKAVNENIELKAKMQEEKVAELVSEAAKGIEVESKKEKFIQLAEGLAFSGEETFKDKLNILKESLSEEAPQPLTEQEADENADKEVITESADKTVQDEILTYFQ